MRDETKHELREASERWNLHVSAGQMIAQRRKDAARQALAEGATQTLVAAELGISRAALADLLRGGTNA